VKACVSIVIPPSATKGATQAGVSGAKWTPVCAGAVARPEDAGPAGEPLDALSPSPGPPAGSTSGRVKKGMRDDA